MFLEQIFPKAYCTSVFYYVKFPLDVLNKRLNEHENKNYSVKHAVNL